MEIIADVIHRGNAPTGVALPLPTLSALRKTGHCSWIGNLHWIIDRINLLSRIINKYFNCPKYLASIWTLFGSIYRVFFGSVLVLWRPSSESESTNCGNIVATRPPPESAPPNLLQVGRQRREFGGVEWVVVVVAALNVAFGSCLSGLVSW